MRVNHQGDVKLALELHASETAQMVADQLFVSPTIVEAETASTRYNRGWT